jgi:hypothetical protein
VLLAYAHQPYLSGTPESVTVTMALPATHKPLLAATSVPDEWPEIVARVKSLS